MLKLLSAGTVNLLKTVNILISERSVLNGVMRRCGKVLEHVAFLFEPKLRTKMDLVRREGGIEKLRELWENKKEKKKGLLLFFHLTSSVFGCLRFAVQIFEIRL
jgi:hypothetical protein